MAFSIHPTVIIHSSAIVDEGATIGSGSRVWHWVHICSGAVTVGLLIGAERVCGQSGANR